MNTPFEVRVIAPATRGGKFMAVVHQKIDGVWVRERTYHDTREQAVNHVVNAIGDKEEREGRSRPEISKPT